jgi:hypothetical protein
MIGEVFFLKCINNIRSEINISDLICRLTISISHLHGHFTHAWPDEEHVTRVHVCSWGPPPLHVGFKRASTFDFSFL